MNAQTMVLRGRQYQSFGFTNAAETETYMSDVEYASFFVAKSAFTCDASSFCRLRLMAADAPVC